MVKAEVNLLALRWALRHLYAAREDAALCDELHGEVPDGFIEEIDRLCKPLEHRLLRMERKAS